MDVYDGVLLKTRIHKIILLLLVVFQLNQNSRQLRINWHPLKRVELTFCHHLPQAYMSF